MAIAAKQFFFIVCFIDSFFGRKNVSLKNVQRRFGVLTKEEERVWLKKPLFHITLCNKVIGNCLQFIYREL